MNALFKIVSLLIMFTVAGVAYAGETDRVKGWAWSSNIGWISFNCTNLDTCGNVDYGVTVNNANTNLSGYAWSENVGWIDFSGATFNSGTGIISGNAQVLAGNDSSTDGWDGVIQLSDNSPIFYNVDVQNNSEATGWGWGSDVVGWVSFNCSNQSACGTSDYKVFVEPFYFEFTANRGLTTSNSVPYDGSVQLRWTTSGATSCTASGAPATGWAAPPSKPAGEPSTAIETVTNLTANTTFTLTCQDSLGRSITRDLDIFVNPPAPQITITAADTNIPFNTSTTISWNAQFVSACTASGAWSGSKPIGTGQSQSSGNLTNLDNYFILTCNSDNPAVYPNPVTTQVLVNVERLTLDFSLVDDVIQFTEPTEVEYVSSFANACTASGGAGTTWASPSAKGTNTDQVYTETINDATATTTSPLVTGTYQFNLTCTGSLGQTETRSVLLKVGRNPNFSEQIGNDPDAPSN